jgi:hypothetical protein
MKRTIETKRLYPLGDYKNVSFEDSFIELPESLMLNTELINKLRWLQLVEMEKMYYEYLLFKSKYEKKSAEEILKLLEDSQIQTLTLIKKIINGTLKEETPNIKD